MKFVSTAPKNNKLFLVSYGLPCFYLFSIGLQMFCWVLQYMLMGWFIHLAFQFVITAFILRYSFKRWYINGLGSLSGQKWCDSRSHHENASLSSSVKPIWISFKISSHPISPGLKPHLSHKWNDLTIPSWHPWKVNISIEFQLQCHQIIRINTYWLTFTT